MKMKDIFSILVYSDYTPLGPLMSKNVLGKPTLLSQSANALSLVCV